MLSESWMSKTRGSHKEQRAGAAWTGSLGTLRVTEPAKRRQPAVHRESQAGAAMSADAFHEWELRQGPSFSNVSGSISEKDILALFLPSVVQGWKHQNDTGPFSKRGAWTVPNASDPKSMPYLSQRRDPLRQGRGTPKLLKPCPALIR